MSGWTTQGVPTITLFTGLEQTSFDTEAANGLNPQTGSVSLFQLANAISALSNNLAKTMVAGTRYYVSYNIQTPAQLTGILARVGTTGGTDKWIAELHDSTGALVATSALAGITVGAASQWQQFAFTATYNALPGTYYIVIQSNGTTALLDTYNAAALPVTTGSAAGTFGTSAGITPPTTYTANLGPRAQVY